MKVFIRQWILLFGFVVISAFIVPPFFNGYWDNAWFILKLLFTTLIICILQYLLKRLPIEPPLLKHFANMCAVITIVSACGWFWGWFTPAGIWLVCAMVIPVYLVMALVDAIYIRRDVEIINRQLEYRKQKRQGVNQDDC